MILMLIGICGSGQVNAAELFERDVITAAIKQCHEKVHAMGAPRITTTIKAGTRTDRDQTLEDKIDSVKSKLAACP